MYVERGADDCTITTVQQRKLLEITNGLKGFLNEEEFTQIMGVYASVLDRIEKGGGIDYEADSD